MATGVTLITEFSNKDVPGDFEKKIERKGNKTVSVIQEIRRQMSVTGSKGQRESRKRMKRQTS